MARIEPVRSSKAGLYTRIVLHFTRRAIAELTGKATARMVEPLEVYARLPELFKGYAKLEQATGKLHRLPKRLHALAELKAATLTHCEYCIDMGSAISRRWGLSDEELVALPRYATSPLFFGAGPAGARLRRRDDPDARRGTRRPVQQAPAPPRRRPARRAHAPHRIGEPARSLQSRARDRCCRLQRWHGVRPPGRLHRQRKLKRDHASVMRSTPQMRSNDSTDAGQNSVQPPPGGTRAATHESPTRQENTLAEGVRPTAQGVHDHGAGGDLRKHAGRLGAGHHTDDAIVIQGLCKRFGRTVALDGLDLSVRTGEVHAFLGPKGAGKTTTLRILLGLLQASEGEVRLLGGDPWRDATSLHRRLAYVPGDVTLWPDLSGGEIIDLMGRLRRGLDPRRRTALYERFQLDPSKKARTYSKGNRQKVALVAALASNAETPLVGRADLGSQSRHRNAHTGVGRTLPARRGMAQWYGYRLAQRARLAEPDGGQSQIVGVKRRCWSMGLMRPASLPSGSRTTA